MKILTGNDLKSGAVVWWDGSALSLNVDDAVDVGDQGPAILAAEEAARRVNASYQIDAVLDANGVRPGHIKERIRAVGPTVRPDLTINPADTAAIDWVN